MCASDHTCCELKGSSFGLFGLFRLWSFCFETAAVMEIKFLQALRRHPLRLPRLLRMNDHRRKQDTQYPE